MSVVLQWLLGLGTFAVWAAALLVVAGVATVILVFLMAPEYEDARNGVLFVLVAVAAVGGILWGASYGLYALGGAAKAAISAGGVGQSVSGGSGPKDSQSTGGSGPTVGAKTPSPPLADGEPETP